MEGVPEQGHRRVCYLLNSEALGFHYGGSNPMRPFLRGTMTHDLVDRLGLFDHVTPVVTRSATDEEVLQFHDPEYVAFLKKAGTLATPPPAKARVRFGLTQHIGCPCKPNVAQFSWGLAGASICGASLLNQGATDIAVNWSGGHHHAMSGTAHGFCYINDCVLAIMELLKVHQRVLYVDIDVHHGDGVEAAFFSSNRVMTLSLHQYGFTADRDVPFFPGTGGPHFAVAGEDAGRGYALNVPLPEGVGDETYVPLFKQLMHDIHHSYRPEAVVMQCGTDSIFGDPLGSLNLTTSGHAECVSYVRGLGVPLLALGGGGYNMNNAARTWAVETAVLANQHKRLPKSVSRSNLLYPSEYPSRDVNLMGSRGKRKKMPDLSIMEKAREEIGTHLRQLQGPPSVGMVPHFMTKESSVFTEELDEDMLRKRPRRAAGEQQ